MMDHGPDTLETLGSHAAVDGSNGHVSDNPATDAATEPYSKRRGEWGVAENAKLHFALPAQYLAEASKSIGYSRRGTSRRRYPHPPRTTCTDGIAWLRSKGVKKTTKLHCKQRPPKDSLEADREFCVSCAPLAMVVQVALREANGQKLTKEQWTLLAMDLMEINETCERRWHDFFGKYGSGVAPFTVFVEKAGTTMRSFYLRHNLGSFLDDMRLLCGKRRAAQQLGVSGEALADLTLVGDGLLTSMLSGQQLLPTHGSMPQQGDVLMPQPLGNVSLVLHACHAIAQRMDTINLALQDIRSGVQRVEQKFDAAASAALPSAVPSAVPFLAGLSDANAALLDNMFAQRAVAVEVPAPMVVQAEPILQPRLDLLPTMFAGHALAPLDVVVEETTTTEAGHVLPLNLLQFEPAQFDGLLDPYMTITLPHSVSLPDAVQPGV